MGAFELPGLRAILDSIGRLLPSLRSAEPNRSHDPQGDAALGERLAAAWLEAQGYRIAARNLHLGHDEADLVVVGPGGPPFVLAIVEVKSSRNPAAPAHHRIDRGKRQRMIRLARQLVSCEALRDAFVRFDAVSVDLSRDPARLEHLPGCFEADWPTDRRGRRR